MSANLRREMTWTRAVLVAIAITAALLVTLGFVPSIFRYWWASNSQTKVQPFMANTLNIELKDPYTLVRIHDAISMGYQTNVFLVFAVVTYKVMDKRRRRLGQRGAEGVKMAYLPGK